MKSELERASREKVSTSFLLCDIDHFKQVNDRYGHLVGDLVLQEIAQRLIAAVRSYDAVGRYGGEEFLIILSHCDESTLVARSERIRAAIASQPITVGNKELPVSMSVGAITCRNWNPSIPIERILARVDTALYRAKAEGRNRTALANELTTV